MIGFRLIENINKLRIKPTPIATPAKETNGILLARYLKPRRIIRTIKRIRTSDILL